MMDKEKISKEIKNIDREINNLSKQTYINKKIQERIEYLLYKRNIYKMYLNMIGNKKGGKNEYK